MNHERLNPRVDFAFKKIFGSEENKDLLMALVNAVLPAEDQVQSLTLKNPYTLKSRETDKTAILDIRAVDTSGRHLNIEMQVADELGYEKRALFVWSEVYREQLKKGDIYEQLNRTISIHILNFTLMDEPDYHNHYVILNKKSKKEAFSDLQLHTIELNKFEAAHGHEHIKTALDRWVTFLTRAHDLSPAKMPTALKKDKHILKALDVLDSTVLTDEEYDIYRAHIAWVRMELSALEKVRQDGREEGAANLVMTMHKNGLSPEQIHQFTQISLKAILEILN